MELDLKTGMQQALDLLHLQSGLAVTAADEEQIVLIGKILVNRSARGFTLYQEYGVKIVVPLNSYEFPYVFDMDHYIDDNYPHQYINNALCLETDTSIRVRFVDGFSLVAWFSEYVETYFFSYEFFQRFGEYPFGERGHDYSGIMQTYEDLFGEADEEKTFNLMKAIISAPYRGHSPCPCDSGKKLRSCHGPAVMRYYTDERLRIIVFRDYNLIMEEFKT